MVTATENEVRADALVRTAHARVCRYPDTFEGFEAALVWRTDEAAGQGSVVGRKGPEVEAADDTGADLTASLDLNHQERVMRIARGVADGGGGVVVVAHDLNLAAAYADRICLLHRGRVVTTGTPWTTLQAPILEDVFGRRMLVTPSPDDGSPLVVPVRGA